MSSMQDFLNSMDELLDAYRISEDRDVAHARLVGALRVIIPFNVSNENLQSITEELRKSAKNETLKILSKEHTNG